MAYAHSIRISRSSPLYRKFMRIHEGHEEHLPQTRLQLHTLCFGFWYFLFGGIVLGGVVLGYCVFEGLAEVHDFRGAKNLHVAVWAATFRSIMVTIGLTYIAWYAALTVTRPLWQARWEKFKKTVLDTPIEYVA